MAGTLELGPRRGWAIQRAEFGTNDRGSVDPKFLSALEQLNVLYRSLVSIMYNCVPTSGHPGGSISSSRIVEGLLYHTLAYDFSNPERKDADIISYAAGHKALGLYGLWALRNEVVRITHPELLPEEREQLRLEDLLGFRRNPTQHTPLFKKFNAKALDGHPCPMVPFIKLSTGASGVGVPASFGLGLGAMDLFPKNPPVVHVIEGEGGLTPGRVHEAMATASSANLYNIVLHIDWNQASIDSNSVCREGHQRGDYVQWDPVELARFHDFNVIYVEDGHDHQQVIEAQAYAEQHKNHQPTAIVYRTVKGWKYGIEGRASHGAGHSVCSEEFYNTMNEFEAAFGIEVPRLCEEMTDEVLERYYWDLLLLLRKALEDRKQEFQILGDGVKKAKERLTELGRVPRKDHPRIDSLFDGSFAPDQPPDELITAPGAKNTLRGALGKALGFLNQKTGGGIMVSSADLFGSTSINKANEGFPGGFYNAIENPKSRLVATGGICEDAMGAVMSSLGWTGHHIGAGSSYGAFIAALQHVAIRLHAIGQQAKRDRLGAPQNPYILVSAHAGLKTGEDGPTHADPQCLQLLQENFPKDALITMTPWDPNEVWPVLIEALKARPAVLVPFVTRPSENIFDRKALGLPGPKAAALGLYAMRTADPEGKPYHGTLVLQGSGVTNTFIKSVLPKIDQAGYHMNIYYVSSVELFMRLPKKRQLSIFPEARAQEAMGITGFTLPTMFRWVTSDAGREASLCAFSKGRYLGSGQAHKVLEEAGLHAEGQFEAIQRYAELIENR